MGTAGLVGLGGASSVNCFASKLAMIDDLTAKKTMQKVAVFGNAGAGKSTLSQQIATITNLPLHILDRVQYQPGGVAVSSQEYKQAHAEILASEQWVIDGFGSIDTLWLRLDRADTLVYLDLPLPLHFWRVTKRMITGFFVPPSGWPEHSPILKSSLNSYRNLWLCHRKLTPKYRDYVAQAAKTRRVYHLRSPAQVEKFLESIAHAL
ncbi:hypothetical protein Pse7367_3846 (plasmid) [Thalassoporum mexicanum PCC 7367]|nr:hypothetical protein Pse7367_3846 [Pseudanabaena sp. PCC 7367]